MKLTKRLLRSLILEEVAAEPAKWDESNWHDDYSDFVAHLKTNAADSKVRALLGAGHEDGETGGNKDAFSFGNATPAVSSLTPMQKEIDIDKSLGWPIVNTQGSGLAKNVSASGPVELGSPIVIFNGKYIVDGHHRWSQLYACNRNASIVAIDITNPHIKPLEALKAVQASIAHQIGDVPVQTVDSVNLIGIDEGALRGWLEKNVTRDVVANCTGAMTKIAMLAGESPEIVDGEGFEDMRMIDQLRKAPWAQRKSPKFDKKTGKPGKDPGRSNIGYGRGGGHTDEKNLIIEAIVKNVESMNSTSRPISGAPSRSEMPQTDNVNWMPPLEDGEIDIEEPHASSGSVRAERRTRSGDIFVERWQKLAGILKD